MSCSLPVPISTLLAHLGGPRIFAMAFRSVTYDVRSGRPATAGVAGVTLSIAPSLVSHVPGRATHVVVNLMADDTYAVILHRVPSASQILRGKRGGLVTRIDGVHADRLRMVVERATGLLLSLGTMGSAPVPSPGAPDLGEP